MLLPILSAIIGIVAFLPLNLYWLGFIFLVPFFYFLYEEKSFWKLLFGAFLFRLIFAVGTVFYTLEVISWMISMGIFLGLVVVIFCFKKMFPNHHSVLMVCIALAYLTFDMLEARYSFLPTYIMTAGNALGSSPFVGLASHGGLLALEFFVILSNMIFLLLVNRFDFLKKSWKKAMLVAIGSFLFFVFFLGLSKYFLAQSEEVLAGKKKHLSVTTISLRKNFSMGDLNELAVDLRKTKTDLVVFPEELFVKQGNEPFDLGEISAIIKKLDLNTAYIAGTVHVFKQEKNYNTTILFDRSGEIVDQYDKNRLTIMGEYWPLSWYPPFYEYLRNDPVMKNYAIFNPANSYEAGISRTIKAGSGDSEILFGSLICLEGHYADLLENDKKNGAMFVINPASNRWLSFGEGQFSHLTGNLYRIESLQSGLPIFVSSINGLAGLFSPDGSRRTIESDKLEEYRITTQDVAY